jgi:hypothetical protein
VRSLPSVERNERVCNALKEYGDLRRSSYALQPRITVEYAILLLCAGVRGERAELGECETFAGPSSTEPRSAGSCVSTVVTRKAAQRLHQ